MASLLRPLVEDLEARRAKIRLGGGEEKIAEQHAREKLTARERIALLVDDGTFVELGIHGRPHFSQRAMDGVQAPADGVITGTAAIDGRTVALMANDLQTTSAGRFMLGLGSQIKPHVEKRFSMPWSHPAPRMRRSSRRATSSEATSAAIASSTEIAVRRQAAWSPPGTWVSA